jgi:TFIIF-interacting CTD phosphatase-like protein
LSLLGRDLNRTIIVDNISENFLLQPENGISIKSWYDDPTDNALMQLAPLLLEIAKQKVSDVKLALRESKEQLLKMIIEGEEDPM